MDCQNVEMGAKRSLRFPVHKGSKRGVSVSVNNMAANLKVKRNRTKDSSTLTPVPLDKFKQPPSNQTTWLGRLRVRRTTQLCQEEKATIVFRDCHTSDYGTASESSRKSSLSSVVGTPDCCFDDKMSGISSLGSSPVRHEYDAECRLSTSGWDSDSEPHPTSSWDFCDDFEVSEMFQSLKEKGINVHLLHNEGVITLIPTINSIKDHCDFRLQIMKSFEYQPCSRLGTIHASHVVSLEPHRSQFHGPYPAVIFLPLTIEPGPTDVLECLYSNTEVGTPPHWEKLPSDHFQIRSGKAIISTHHFSLFTVVIRPHLLESRRWIRQRSGGRLRNASTPGVEINFPRGCLKEDVMASVRVLFDDQDYNRDILDEPVLALASPVVMVGPHGYKFEEDQPPVTIRLPLPDYVQICSQFSGRLSVWQSNTSEDEAASWERIEVDLTIERDPISRLYTATFPVYHFSFFKVLWDILSTSLFEAKMGMSHFYPYISFSMMCQAFMEENADTSRFGLEVICHRSDKRLPELTNYKHRVGASLKPKLIKPGKILVRLKSQLFEADVDAGEDPEMVKEEYDFRGRDFEKQYACRFKTGVVVSRGTFGKVIVERSIPGGSMLEQLFEFNLHKTGNECEATPPECSDRWSIVAIKELAGTLRILEDQNWKTLARYIGFTRSEIKAKLQYSADPFLSMMNMYQARGGSPEEFLQALYAVSRELQIGGAGANLSQRGSQSGSSHGSSPSGSHNSSQSSLSPARKRGLWALASLAPWRSHKDEDSDTSGTRSQESVGMPLRKRSNPGAENSNASSKGKTLSSSNKHSGGSGPKPVKRPRRQYSDYSETVSSASSASSPTTDEDGDDGAREKESVRSQRRIMRRACRKKSNVTIPADSGSEDERSTEKCKRDPRTMTDGDLWRVSAFMNKINWRALGRTLGLQESALVNVETSYKTAGCRECAYQMLLEWKGLKPKSCTVGSLFSALTKENMNEVAKEMAAIDFGVNE